MKVYQVTGTFKVNAHQLVEANSREEAIEKVKSLESFEFLSSHDGEPVHGLWQNVGAEFPSEFKANEFPE
jgi:hypothetical protein